MAAEGGQKNHQCCAPHHLEANRWSYENGSASLFIASAKGHAAVVTLLLDRDADIEAKNKVCRCCAPHLMEANH